MTERGEATPRTANRHNTTTSEDDGDRAESSIEYATVGDSEVDAIGNGSNPEPESAQDVSRALFATQTTGHSTEAVHHETSPPMDDAAKVQQKNGDIPSEKNPDAIHINSANRSKEKPTKRRKIKSTKRKEETKGRTFSSNKPHFSRKRGRPARMVPIERIANSTVEAHPLLPGNQYTTTLHRRAVRKLPEGERQQHSTDHDLDECGDVSLGMKLIVVGGRVIVQNLNDLADGLASPAQLAGKIQRGDVLLAIGSVSLVNLPVDQLMDGLRPLSTPGPGGYYERNLVLRFESGSGLELLKIHEEGQIAKLNRQEPADAMFSLFPMVDQLSGAPLFENHVDMMDMMEEKGEHKDEETKQSHSEDECEAIVKDLDALIASTLARERTIDQERYQSEYFGWREDLSVLLRKTVSLIKEGDSEGGRLTQTERVALGKRILQITRVLATNMEEIDKGRDLRSFKTWSTNFSLRSGVSARRRHFMDSTSFRSSRGSDDDSLEENDSNASEHSDGSLEGVDADTLLLGLAARDEIWRKQVLDALEKAVWEADNGDEDGREDENSTIENQTTNINEALSQQLGNFLFGDMTKIVKHERRSLALPPVEITRVLFDLTTNLAAKTPDEITLIGGTSRLSSNVSSLFSATTRTDTKSKAAFRADLLVANRFVLDEALPKWLRSFRPLPLEQRRVLWPRSYRRPDATTSTYTGQISEYTGRSSEGDTFTIDSGGGETQGSSPGRKKGMRELVEDQQINSETRSETCFLVTYFFTHQIVGGGGTIEQIAEKGKFIDRYGAYLQMHTCLSFASFVKDEVAITYLLKVAKFDPNHSETIKEIKRSKNLVFYDSLKLSAVLELLHDIPYDDKEERRHLIRDLCVSAYPDILPWQVRQVCLSDEMGNPSLEAQPACSEDELEGFYYSYLSQLLHPFDGNDRARHDDELLEEYCEWSVGLQAHLTKKPDRLENFLNIASRSSIQYHRFKRDLMTLLRLSVVVGKEDLVLDLVDEILDDRKLLLNKDALYEVLNQLRKLGNEALKIMSYASNESTGFRILGRILKLLEKMASSDSIICRDSLVVSDELFSLFQKWKKQVRTSGDDEKIYLLIDFVIDESSAPEHVFRALALWSSSNSCGDLLFPRLRSLLRRGVHFAALKGELSGTLLRLRHARGTFKELNMQTLTVSSRHTKNGVGIWEDMATANLSIDK
ncbi:hypothetical protein IV203_005882 [Nitzschia inconspicua]|uniref:PDZ domain-containing protein n=1 Tax=Nitzschia inconspicua TaxID=303405 RepID=A0A9K3PGS6_9STRA|nr:hypothetical protein IV203_005882 [Nitzschia inconspicua]